jgi:stage II sporulation protein D
LAAGATVAGLFPFSRSVAAEEGDLVRVGLITGQAEARLGGLGRVILGDTSGNVLGWLESELTLTAGPDGQIVVPGAGSFPGPLTLRPEPSSPSGSVVVAGHPYRGEIQVLVRDGRLTVVNSLPLEDYLLGVVPREMPAGFPLEALKAQAVAARTYALYVRTAGTYAEFGYDLVPTTACQVYGGVEAERESTTLAVRGTAGEVITYGGRYIGAFFHSTSGGFTESVEFVWGFACPYLKGVPDLDQESAHHTWSLSLTQAELTAKLEAAGHGVGEVLGLEGVPPQGPGGRYLERLVAGRAGQARLRSEELRSILGLRSTRFEVRGEKPKVESVAGRLDLGAVSVVGADGQATASSATVSVLGATQLVAAALAEAWAVAPVLVPATFIFDGHGWGHGVGLSQWGARGLALEGKTYRDILTYYYTGVTVGTMP